MSFNLLKGFWILLTIALIVYAVIITIQITKVCSNIARKQIKLLLTFG